MEHIDLFFIYLIGRALVLSTWPDGKMLSYSLVIMRHRNKLWNVFFPWKPDIYLCHFIRFFDFAFVLIILFSLVFGVLVLFIFSSLFIFYFIRLWRHHIYNCLSFKTFVLFERLRNEIVRIYKPRHTLRMLDLSRYFLMAN